MNPLVPRFVPTLTDVLGEQRYQHAAPSGHEPGANPPDLGEEKPLGSGLQRDVRSPPEPAEAGLHSSSFERAGSSRQAASSDGGELLQAELVHRVLQRVDMMLTDRLAVAITTVMARYTREIVPALREEIAEAVRVSVTAAVALELSDRATAPKNGA
jgi:hypothetical protein